MRFVQFYLDCLSQASYLVGDEETGRAVVVDPRRDVDIYLDDAAEAGLTIELIIETHFHADFVSGHLELAAATGAEIAYGSSAVAEFPIRHLRDGERVSLGNVTLEVRETPGHTPESISIVVWERATDPTPYGVLTGDSLFIGDVGRPDLLGSAGFTADDMARRLYRSLRDKLLTLPDPTRVFPAHGAGSSCGRNLSTEKSSSIGEQRRTNYALQAMTEDAFVALVSEGQPTVPEYFGYDADLNRHSRPLLDEHADLPQLSVSDVLAAQDGGASVLDVRPMAEFAAGHLRGTLHAGLDTRFAEYAGCVVSPGASIVLVGDHTSAVEAKVRLARIGYDGVVGYLPAVESCLADCPDLGVRTSTLSAAQLAERQETLLDLQIVDVRNPGETAAGALPEAVLVPLASLQRRLSELDPRRPVALYCAGGIRSLIATSLLEKQGFTDVSTVLGGYAAITAFGSAPCAHLLRT